MASRFLRLPRTLPSSVQLTSATRFNVALTQSVSRLNQIQLHTSTKNMADTSTYRANGDNGDDGSTDGDLNQWKFRAPYKVHENDPNFHVRYEASCHCGKVQYQLSREKPLDSKFCHCTTCQKIHGKPYNSLSFQAASISFSTHLFYRSTFPMGSHIPQRRHQFHPRPP